MDNPYAVTAAEFGEAVETFARAFVERGIYNPIMAWGDPGLGKTGAVHSAAERLGYRLLVRHVADQEPTEMGGIYWHKDGQVVRLPPGDFPSEDGVPTILFYDEVPQAPMMNKNILARIVLDRRVAEAVLGDKVYVCLAGNYARNRAGTSPMPSHLNARIDHFHVVPDREAWGDWAIRNGVHPFVRAFQKDAPEYHHKPDPDAEASPNPRSWARVSEIEKSGASGQIRKAAIVGAVGQEAGTVYLSRAELYGQMPPVEDVLRDPARTEVPTNRSVLFALVSALAENAKPSNIGKIITYTNRFKGDEEYQALCLREAKIKNPAVASAKEFTAFALSAKGQSLV